MDKFLKKINKTKTCWLWTAAKRSSGYGMMRVGKKFISSHRYSYQLFIGKIKKGMDVCHTCDIRLCVNPDHLWLGTRKENMQDALKKGRLVFPKKIYNSAKEQKKACWDRYYKKHKKDISIRRKEKRRADRPVESGSRL